MAAAHAQLCMKTNPFNKKVLCQPTLVVLTQASGDKR